MTKFISMSSLVSGSGQSCGTLIWGQEKSGSVLFYVPRHNALVACRTCIVRLGFEVIAPLSDCAPENCLDTRNSDRYGCEQREIAS